MPRTLPRLRPLVLLCALGALALPGCATTPYTGPVEVTRFLAEDTRGLAQGTITVIAPTDIANAAVSPAFTAAVSAELARLGYTVVPQGSTAAQTATIFTSRNAVAAMTENRRGPVNVGVGGQTGGFGSGVGMGVGINLGGGRENPNVITDLAVRIARTGGETLWEGRAQLATGVKSPYSQIDASARALAAGLFRGFPGGNGETVTIDVKNLQGAQ